MALAPGSMLGPYEVLSLVGAGGMGQVYRARDTRLGRIVALKILPPHRSAIRDFADRFQREARAVSSLNHPNVCALYDVGEADGVSYLVMEFLEGETLRDKMRERIAIRTAIEIAMQVAYGLAAAHRKGLVHRDLKPENIFVTRDGVVKVLDFGLVKAVEREDDPAVTIRRTEPGLMVGTAHYVAPEQIRGEAVDHRADIFSFGVVLYEMLSGQPPFDGDSAVDTMARTLHDEPRPLGELVPDLPPGLDPIAARCLSKDPDDRFVSARDLAFALDAISRGSRSPQPFTRPQRDSRVRPTSRVKTMRSRAVLGLAAVSGLALVIIGGRYLARDAAPPAPPATRTLTHSGKDHSPAASPDGRLIAFVSSRDGSRRIWLKQLADGTEVALTSGPNDAHPRFSPDGASVIFTRATSIYRVAVVGGEARKLIDDATDGDFSPDGRQLVFSRDRRVGERRISTICISDTSGGNVRELAASENVELWFPRWSPDGDWIAVTRRPRSSVGGSVLLLRTGSDEQRVVERREPHGVLSSVAWTRDGSAFLVAELEGINAVAIRSRGSAARVMRYERATKSLYTVLWNPHASADTIDLLADGRIVFTEDFTRINLQEVGPTGSRWLTRGSAVDRQPTYAPDGKHVVFCSDRGGSPDLWELDVASGSVRRLTDDPGVDWDPAVTSDGKLLWSSSRGGHFEVWLANGDGSAARQLTSDGVDAENPTSPAIGERVFYDSSNPEKEGLWRIERDGSGATRVYEGETAHPEASADGKYVVFHAPEADSAMVQVVRVEDGALFTVARGLRPRDAGRSRWLGASHTIVFEADDEQGRSGLFAQDFVENADTSASRRRLAGFDSATAVETFAVSPDGQRIVLSLLEPSTSLMLATPDRGTSPERP